MHKTRDPESVKQRPLVCLPLDCLQWQVQYHTPSCPKEKTEE
jgi:hypothetical protein